MSNDNLYSLLAPHALTITNGGLNLRSSHHQNTREDSTHQHLFVVLAETESDVVLDSLGKVTLCNEECGLLNVPVTSVALQDTGEQKVVSSVSNIWYADMVIS